MSDLDHRVGVREANLVIRNLRLSNVNEANQANKVNIVNKANKAKMKKKIAEESVQLKHKPLVSCLCQKSM